MKSGGQICELSKTPGTRESFVRKTIWRTIQRANNSFWRNDWISSNYTEIIIKHSSISQESYTSNLCWTCTDRGRNLERIYSDCRCGRVGKVGRIRNLSLKNQRKRSIDRTKRRRIMFPFRRWYSKFVRKRLRIPRMKPVATSGRSNVTSFIVITMNLEFNSMCRRRNIPYNMLKYIDVTRSMHTDSDVMLEERVDDYWNVGSNRSLSDSWKGFTKFTLLKGKPPKEKNVVRGETDKSSNDNETRSCVAWGMVQNWKSSPESRNTIMEEWITDPSDEEYKEITKNARKKSWKYQWNQPCLARRRYTWLIPLQETVANPKASQKVPKTKLWLHSGISWIHETKSGTVSTQTSRRSYCWQGIYVDDPLQIWFTNSFGRHKQ